MTVLPHLLFSSTLLALTAVAQVTTLAPLIVTGRQVSPAADSPWSVTTVDTASLAAQPGQPLDQTLRNVPGFSLFRRSDSRTANPTAQGVTLRGLGPSGASRALVLLDGVPVNDPFGGWITWSALDASLISQVEITRSGGAGPWGSGALGGTLHLYSAPLTAGGQAAAGFTHDDGRHAALQAGGLFRTWAIQAGAAFTHGVRLPVLRADQRGAVDTAAFADTERYQIEARHQLGELEAGLRASYFDEQRNNGTALTTNSTQARDLSLWLKQTGGRIPWELRAWRQQRDFASTFTSVNATRTTETPALNQYSVPALASGASALARFTTDAHALVIGADARTIRGTTHEQFRYLGTAFTRDRAAGGRQTLAGIFAEDQVRASDTLRITLGGRLDHWALTDGERRETDLATGLPTRHDRFADRDGTRAHGRLGVNYQPGSAWTFRGAGYTGFRVATLNELYRPFRVRNDVTEANPALQPERVRGVELGAEWRPATGWTLGLTGYDNRLHDLIANATLAVGPATVPGFDPVLAGGVLRQRANSGQARVRGLEFTATRAAMNWTTAASATLTDARWDNASGPLTTQRLVQTPRWTSALSATWHPTATWSFSAQARAVGRQYEDDLNRLRLGAFAVADVALSYDLTARLRSLLPHGRCIVRLGVENIFAEEIETAKTADGLVSIGSPRLLTLSWRVHW